MHTLVVVIHSHKSLVLEYAFLRNKCFNNDDRNFKFMQVANIPVLIWPLADFTGSMKMKKSVLYLGSVIVKAFAETLLFYESNCLYVGMSNFCTMQRFFFSSWLFSMKQIMQLRQRHWY